MWNFPGATTLMAFIGPVLGGALACLLTCGLLVLTQRWHGRFTLDGSEGVQKFHLHPTPRVGGIGIAVGMTVVWVIAPEPARVLIEPMLWAGIPAFAFGLAEDMTKSVGPAWRLGATMLSGVAACMLTGLSLSRTELAPLDALLMWWPASVAFTAFAAAGVANAINIVDGFNGLASGLTALALLALGAMAARAGDPVLAQCCIGLAAVVLGFMVLNFPLGKIFLGDGGAYLLGFWLAWLAVLLMHRNVAVEPAAVLLACAYPVVEVLFSMVRRWRRHLPAMHPDRLHLHSLVKCRIARKRLEGWPPVLQNASVSPLVWLIAAVPALGGVLAWNSPGWAYAGLVGFVGLYLLIYRRLALFGWR